MRQGDTEEAREHFKRQRFIQSLAGILLIVFGGLVLFFLNTSSETVRHAISFALIALGGMMINENLLLRWLSIFRPEKGPKP